MDFQTPPEVCDYMVKMIPYCHETYLDFDYGKNLRILEPIPGQGNLVNSLHKHLKSEIITPNNFWDLPKNERYNWVVMNPPFSPMKQGYEILYRCMDMSDNIIALMPWLTIINGEKRTHDIIDFGLKSITHLPRNIFKGSRVQCCILEMQKWWKEETTFKTF